MSGKARSGGMTGKSTARGTDPETFSKSSAVKGARDSFQSTMCPSIVVVEVGCTHDYG